MGSGSTPLLPGSSVRVGRRHAAQFALVAFAGAAVICSVYLAARPVVLAQFDGHVQRERSEWDALDSGFIERRPLARAPAAFSLLRAVDHTMSLARAEQEDSKPMVRKAWSKVDRIVGLMDAEDDSEFTALQQLAKVSAGGVWCLQWVFLHCNLFLACASAASVGVSSGDKAHPSM